MMRAARTLVPGSASGNPIRGQTGLARLSGATMTITRRCALGLLAGALVPRPAGAQAFPTRPMTIVVPYPPGGPTDAIARIVAQELQPRSARTSSSRTSPARRGRSARAPWRSAEPDGHTHHLRQQPDARQQHVPAARSRATTRSRISRRSPAPAPSSTSSSCARTCRRRRSPSSSSSPRRIPASSTTARPASAPARTSRPSCSWRAPASR